MKDDHSEMIEILSVLNNPNGDCTHVSLFEDFNVQYEIPIYQRAFAWGTGRPGDINYVNEIVQLMDDVCEAKAENYYIGSLVVWKKSGDGTDTKTVYEVIDGQQRLTALYIILKCLNSEMGNIIVNPLLSYKCREKSKNAIENLDEIINAIREGCFKTIQEDEVSGSVAERENRQWKIGDTKTELENSICDAVRTVIRKFKEKKDYSSQLFESLNKVRLYRIEVPQDTDLNKYFEIMNVRGRQLEPSDIVKARLMGDLDTDQKKEWFARIWNACRDMTGYVQMHFENGKEQKVRDCLFGCNWDTLPSTDSINKVIGNVLGNGQVTDEAASVDNRATESTTIIDALLNPQNGSNKDLEIGGDTQCDDDDERFCSIIDFPHFLLHVLKVFRGQHNDTNPTDARALVTSFENAFRSVENENKADWSWKFIMCLLRCRFLFDKYMIKRDYGEDPDDGEWSLFALNRTNETSWNYQPTNGVNDVNKQCLMIQSCLRVTYTERKRMHWITHLLGKLYENSESGRSIDMKEIVQWGEGFAKNGAKTDWEELNSENFRMGTKTPHLLLNYLDYLLWKKWKSNRLFKTQGGKEESFEFAYRESVEHWYPQHPSDGTFTRWNDVDRFGNLALLSKSVNSKFSNLSPESKWDTYKRQITCGSLKLRIMSKITCYRGSDVWRKNLCELHEKAMLKILQQAFET